MRNIEEFIRVNGGSLMVTCGYGGAPGVTVPSHWIAAVVGTNSNAPCQGPARIEALAAVRALDEELSPNGTPTFNYSYTNPGVRRG